MRASWPWIVIALVAATAAAAEPLADPKLARDILPLFKAHCVKCHGPGKHEAELNLSTPLAVARGGESGRAIEPGQLDASLLWQRIDAGEMPPDEPLDAETKSVLKRWIETGRWRLAEAARGSADWQ